MGNVIPQHLGIDIFRKIINICHICILYNIRIILIRLLKEQTTKKCHYFIIYLLFIFMEF